MKATIYGFEEHKKERFSYELNNVIAVNEINNVISIQYMETNGKPYVNQYMKNDVKIVIEN